MSSQEDLSTLERAVQLFGFEVGEGSDSSLWQDPDLRCLKDKRIRKLFSEWVDSKRNFTIGELLHSHWLVLFRKNNEPLYLHFTALERLDAAKILDIEERLQGSWQLVATGLQQLHLLQIDIAGRMQLFVCANNENALHSALLLAKNGDESIQTYCNFIEIKSLAY